MLRIRTLARRTIIAASGHGRQRGECEREGGVSGAMSLVSGSWIGWVWWLVAGGRVLTLHQAWWGARLALVGSEV